MSQEDDVIMRKAREDDYDDIVTINSHLDGLDYLPYIFKQVLQEEDVYPVVAEVKGQRVGFCMLCFVDGGHVAIRRAARVHQTFRKMGIYHKITDELDRYIKENKPNVRYITQSVGIDRLDRVIRDFTAHGYKEIKRVPIQKYDYRLKDLVYKGREELPDATPLSFDDVKLLFTLHDVLDKFFVSKRVFVTFMAYGCLESNIHHLVDEDKKVYVTTRSRDQKSGGTKTWFDDIDVITFSQYWIAEEGLVYCISIYVAEGYGKPSIKAHIEAHVEDVRQLGLGENGAFVVFLGGHSCSQDVYQCMESLGFAAVFKMSDVHFEKNL